MGLGPSSALLSGSSSNPDPPQSQLAKLDKYKALFDASNPDRGMSETQPETGTTAVGTGMLNAVPEEQESQSQSQIQSGDVRGTKRGRIADDDNAEMADVAAEAEQIRVPKRRALGTTVQPPAPATQPKTQTQNSVAVESAATTGTNRIAKPASSAKFSTNKLDTDENFLKAVNSMKRGKKHEDEFDREFNQLRITNPKAKKKQEKGTNVDAVSGDAAAHEVSRPWDSIDDFGDVGLRGNFMVVVEMDVQRDSVGSMLKERNKDDANPEWAGRPNFKKFKKV